MKRPWHIQKFSLRSIDVAQRLDTFLVCAIAAVLGNRFFLVLTGYPQLGNGTLHISHAIWGALMMAVAIIFAISYLPPVTRTFVAFLGGAGFGWFIDELGKFITRDVNYFFQPTIALIYIVFVVMYLAFRSVELRAFRPDEAVLNAIEALKSASLGRLDAAHRREAIALLDSTGAHNQLALEVRALLVDVPAMPPHEPSWWARSSAKFRARYLWFQDSPHFFVAVDGVLLFMAVAKVFEAVGFALDGKGIHGFTEWASVISSLVSGSLILIGAVVLPRSRVAALRWFDRGLLVEILVTQVFVFQQHQLGGLLSLALTIVVWIFVRSAMKAERERASIIAAEMEATAPQAVS